MKYRKAWYEKAMTALEGGRIVILQGLRRIGKTTVLEEIKNRYKADLIKSHSFNVFGQDDNEYLLSLLEELPDDKNVLLAFDEFQDFPEWNKFFKTIYDQFKHVKIIAVGSVSHNSTSTDNTEGGRYQIINMPTLSFVEYIKIFGKIDISTMDLENFNQYATRGSYPILEWSRGDLNAYKQQVSTNIIEKIKDSSLLSKSSIAKSGNVDAVLRYIIPNVGQHISSYSISKNTSVRKETTNKIIEYLKNNHIIYKINNIVKGDAKSSALDSKYYLTDHTFYLFIESASFANLETKYKSFVFENIVCNEFRRRYTRHDSMIYFIKDKKNKWDLDLQLNIDGKKYVFEIKDSISTNSLTADQKRYAIDHHLNVIYHGESKQIKNINYINIIDFMKGSDKWI